MEKALGVENEEQLMDKLSAWPGRSEGLARPRDDPYAEASITFEAQSALPRLSVDQRENRKLVMKRKVLRHRPDGGMEVSDESVGSEPGCSANLQSPGHPSIFLEDTISEGELDISSSLEDCLHYDDEWLLEDSPCSLLEDCETQSCPVSQYSAPAAPRTSYILPQAAQPARTDRVAKFNKYKQDWKKFSFPGEDPHDDLRLAVRRQMNQPGPPPRAPKRPLPNNYVVPTSKQRAALRWGVRQDLAHCIVPRRNNT